MKIIHFNHLAQLIVLVLAVIALSGCDRNKPNEPDFAIETYHGKWFILNYWAQWCAPCIEEIPELNQLQKQYPAKIVVAGVNYDNIRGETLSQLVNAMSIEYLNLENDPADILRLARPAALPTTYIFNPQGQLAGKLVGPQTAQSILEMTDINSPRSLATP